MMLVVEVGGLVTRGDPPATGWGGDLDI